MARRETGRTPTGRWCVSWEREWDPTGKGRAAESEVEVEEEGEEQEEEEEEEAVCVKRRCLA